jgi:hypothetical protein
MSVDLLLADYDMVGHLDSGRNDTIAAICCDAEMAVAGIPSKAMSHPGFSLTGLDEQGDKNCLCHQAVRKIGFYTGCFGSVGPWPGRDYDGIPSVEETLEILDTVSRENLPKSCDNLNARLIGTVLKRT